MRSTRHRRRDRAAAPPHTRLAYSGGSLDRAARLRQDHRWVEAMLHAPSATVIPLWRDKCFVESDRTPVGLQTIDAGDVLESAAEVVFLGLDGEAAVFAADLSSLPEAHAVHLVGSSGVLDLRGLVGTLDMSEAATLAYARGILHWSRHQRYCGRCGCATTSRNGGHLRVCLRHNCTTPLFPRIEPAIIALVEAPGTPGRCLLGRRRGAAPDSYALLAGFVEVGENLEDAVRREVAEEAGVELAAVTYQASQAWPFPAGLMVGFRAVAVSDAVCADDDELEEVRWFTRADMRQRAAAGPGRPPPFNADSIESWLVESWIRESDRRPRTKAGGIR